MAWRNEPAPLSAVVVTANVESNRRDSTGLSVGWKRLLGTREPVHERKISVRILFILLKAARVGHNRIHAFTDERRGTGDMTLRPIRRDGVRTTDPNDDVQDLSRVHGAAKFRPRRHKRYN